MLFIKSMRFFILFILTFFSVASYAEVFTYEGYIEKVEVHADNWKEYNENDIGILSIWMEGMPKSCNDTNGYNRTVIRSSHNLYDSVLSVVLAAKLANKKVKLTYLDTCNTRFRAWDFGYISLVE